MNKYSFHSFSHRRIILKKKKMLSLDTQSILELPSIDTIQKTSALVTLENLKVRTKADALFSMSKTLENRSVNSFSASQMPSAVDFDSLVKRLDNVISKKRSVVKRSVIEDGTNEFSLDTGAVKFLTVKTNGRRCPLKITCYQIQGHLRIFMSKTFSEPDEQSHDKEIKQPVTIVKEPGTRFKSKYIFIGMVALEHSIIKINLAFGKKKRQLSNVPAMNIASNDSLDRGNLAISKSSAKIAIKSPRKDIIQEWDTRRQKALIKKDLYMQEKKEKSWMFMNKNLIKKREREEAKEREKEKLEEVSRQKTWFKILVGMKMIHMFEFLRRENRNLYFKKLKRSNSIRKIQKVFRKKRTMGDLNDCFIIVAVCNLKFFASVAPNKTNKLIGFMQISAQNLVFERKFLKYRRYVMLMQQSFRKIVKKNRDRKFLISNYWGQVLSQLIYDLEKKKNRKKNQATLDMYFNIKHHTRDDAIEEFFNDKKREFNNKAAAYIDQIEDLKKHGAKNFKGDIQILKKGFPSFDFMPSESEMIALINKACKVNN